MQICIKEDSTAFESPKCESQPLCESLILICYINEIQPPYSCFTKEMRLRMNQLGKLNPGQTLFTFQLNAIAKLLFTRLLLEKILYSIWGLNGKKRKDYTADYGLGIGWISTLLHLTNQSKRLEVVWRKVKYCDRPIFLSWRGGLLTMLLLLLDLLPLSERSSQFLCIAGKVSLPQLYMLPDMDFRTLLCTFILVW